MAPNRLLPQSLVFWLILSLTAPLSAYAMRETATAEKDRRVRAGLEEALRSGDPAAGMEEAARRFKEKYHLRRVTSRRQLMPVMETLQGGQGKSLDKQLRVAEYFLSRLQEFHESNLSNFLPEFGERSPAILELKKFAESKRFTFWTVGSSLTAEELTALFATISELTGLSVEYYQRLSRKPPMLRTPLERERLLEHFDYQVVLMAFLKYRDYAKGISHWLEEGRSRWRTPEVRERFIPMNVESFISTYSDATDGKPARLDLEVGVFNALVEEAGLGSVHFITGQNRRKAFWPKDQSLVLPGFVGLVQLKDPPTTKPRLNFLDPGSYPLATLSEGGAFVSGIGNTPFILYSDEVDLEAIEGARAVIPGSFPELSNLAFYQLPGGFVTYRYQGRELLLGNRHLDTVIGFIPKEVTLDGRAKLIVDPLYLKEVEGREEFRRFQREQQEAMDIVAVEEEERHYNPANVATIFPDGELKIVLNYAPNAIKKLGLERQRYFAIQQKEYALWKIASSGGGLGCLCGLDLVEEKTDGQISGTERIDPAAGMEERPWPGFVSPEELMKVLRMVLEATLEAKERGLGLRRGASVSQLVSAMRWARVESPSMQNLMPEAKWGHILSRLPDMLAGEKEPADHHLPQAIEIINRINFVAFTASITHSLWREGQLSQEMSAREMAEVVLSKLSGGTLSSIAVGRSGGPLSEEEQLIADMDRFVDPELQRKMVGVMLEVLLAPAGMEEDAAAAEVRRRVESWINLPGVQFDLQTRGVFWFTELLRSETGEEKRYGGVLLGLKDAKIDSRSGLLFAQAKLLRELTAGTAPAELRNLPWIELPGNVAQSAERLGDAQARRGWDLALFATPRDPKARQALARQGAAGAVQSVPGAYGAAPRGFAGACAGCTAPSSAAGLLGDGGAARGPAGCHPAPLRLHPG